MLPWKTSRLSEYADDMSPSGAAEIRPLLSRSAGDLTHVRVPARSTSEVAVMKDTSEFFYVVSGSGRLRCSDSSDEGYSLRPQTCVSIPAGVSYQYDNQSDIPLDIVLAVVPGWHRENHQASMMDDAWAPRLRGQPLDLREAEVSTLPPSGSSEVLTLSSEPNAIAPDGSEIRFLARNAQGSFVHCRLGAGLATQPVHHLTVEEIWYVLSGQGELWRSIDGTEEVVALEAGVCVDIPLPVDFQFRSIGPAPLDLLLLTTPPWPDDTAEAVPASNSQWTATAVSSGGF